MSRPDPETIARLGALIWQNGRKVGELLQHLRLALMQEHPAAWALAQSVELAHPVFSLREEARQCNARWARERGLPPHLWADRVAALGPKDSAQAERFLRLQSRRLEASLRCQHVWPHEALAGVIRQKEPIQGLLLALLWVDEHERLCWLDEHGQPRGPTGNTLESSALRMAHPRDPALQGLDLSELRTRIDTTASPFAQIDREHFGPDSLTLDTHGWYRPRWDAPLPVYKLLNDLRRRLGWRLTQAEDNGTVAGFFLSDERAELTALWRMMNEKDEPEYGHPLYGGSRPPDYPLRVGLLMLRGRWDRSRIGWSYAWPPKKVSFNNQMRELCAPIDADPIFLSEVLRDVWLACEGRCR